MTDDEEAHVIPIPKYIMSSTGHLYTLSILSHDHVTLTFDA